MSACLAELTNPFLRAIDAHTASGARWGDLILAADAATLRPQFALEELPEEYQLKALIPGARADDVVVDAQAGRVRVCGTADTRFTDGRMLAYVRREQVDESFTLPTDADGGAATWSHRNGVTTVRIPRRLSNP